MSVAEMLERAYAPMDKSTGMFPDTWRCLRCDKPLNADGGHPAELYAGTYNGLCYPCTNAAGYVVEVLEDGCQRWSYPPHCPSWRRDRESALGYPDCPDCKGSGRVKPTPGRFGGSVPSYCRDCMQRHTKRGKYDTRSYFSREDMTRDERMRLTYVEAVGHEPSVPEDPAALAQWLYASTPKERRALKEVLQQ